MTLDRTSNVPYRPDRTVPSAAPDTSGRITRQGPGRSATLLVVLLGVGAAWAWSRPRPAHRAKRRPDMPTLAGGRGLHVERTVTVQQLAGRSLRARGGISSLSRACFPATSSPSRRPAAGGRDGSWPAPAASGRAGKPSSPPTSRAGSSRGAPCRARASTSEARSASSRAGRARHGGQGDPHLRAARRKAGRRRGGAGRRRRRPARPRGAAPVQAAPGDRRDRRGFHATRALGRIDGGPRRPERLTMRAVCWHGPGTSASRRSRIRRSSIRATRSSA